MSIHSQKKHLAAAIDRRHPPSKPYN